jgi:hypothetical protein
MININPQKEFERLIPIALSKACFSVKFSSDVMKEYNQKSKEISESARKYGQHYSSDGQELDERFINGHIAQVAIEEHLGIKFTEWGSSKPNGVADLLPAGLNIGVKSFKIAQKNAPMISRVVKYPEIIMAIDGEDKNIYHCLGVFSVKVLTYPDFICDDLVKTKAALERKTAFYKIDYGVPFNTFDQLKKIVGPLWTI